MNILFFSFSFHGLNSIPSIHFFSFFCLDVQVQEVHVTTTLDRSQMKLAVQRVTGRVL